MIKAYAATEAGSKLEPFEYDPGELAENEVEIDVLHCGICHSDLSVLNNDWGNSRFPVVPGHEVVGRIAQIGAQVSSFAEGDVVGLGWHAGYCGECSQCDVGDQNMCQRARATIIGHHGGFADKVRAAADSVVAIPDGMDLKTVGPLFCGGITVFNPLVQFDLAPTSKVAVIGIGGLGHMALMFLKAWGCEVTAFTSNSSKTDELKEMGAHHVLNSRSTDELKAARGSFDMIISTVNVKLDWPRYLGTLAPRGRLHFVGATTEPIDVSVFHMMDRQLSISASPVGSPTTIAKMLEFAHLHNIKPIVEEFAFDQVNEALEHLHSGKARYRVVLSR